MSVGLLGEGFVCVRARASVCVWPAITVCTHLKSSRIRHVRWTRGTSVLSSVPRNIGAVARGARPGKNSEREAVIGGTIRLAWSPEQV